MKAMTIDIQQIDSNPGRKEVEHFLVTHLPGTGRKPIPSPREQADENSLIYAFKALLDGQCVGALYAETPRVMLAGILEDYPQADARPIRQIVCLERLVVREDVRHSGVGRALIDAFEERATAEGVVHVFGQVDASAGFFERQSYSICEEVSEPLHLAFRMPIRGRTAGSVDMQFELQTESGNERFFVKSLDGSGPREVLLVKHSEVQPLWDQLFANLEKI